MSKVCDESNGQSIQETNNSLMDSKNDNNSKEASVESDNETSTVRVGQRITDFNCSSDDRMTPKE